MRSACLVLALLLTPSLSWGGQAAKRMMAVMYGKPVTHTINGISSISSSGATDTGTETKNGLGTVSFSASCNGGDGDASVVLMIEGQFADQLYCDYGEIRTGNVTHFVMNQYSVQIYGVTTGTGTFTANNFNLP